MAWPSRSEIVRQLGLDLEVETNDRFGHMRDLLKYQREEDIDACNKDGHFTNYTVVASDMYLWAFGLESISKHGIVADPKRGALWFLGRKPIGDPKQHATDVRMVYSVRQNSRFLKVYGGLPNGRQKRIIVYDMQKANDRQAFMYVRKHAAQKLPVPEAPTMAIRKDLLKVQGVHQGGKDRRNRKEKKRAEILSTIPFSQQNQAVSENDVKHKGEPTGD